MRSGVDEKKPFHTPFAGLKDKLGDLPRGPEPREPERRSDAPKGPVFVALPIDVLEQETSVEAAAPDRLWRAIRGAKAGGRS